MTEFFRALAILRLFTSMRRGFAPILCLAAGLFAWQVLAQAGSAPLAAAERFLAIGTDPLAPRKFAQGAVYRVCHTPGQNCESLVVAVIDSATSELDFQAYSFTSRPIAQALLDAQKRGVKLHALFDKSDERDTYGLAAIIARAGIPTRTDFRPAIAHNKVVVTDWDSKPAVVTGSFNFTRSAEDRNAENVLVISGQMDLAQNYAAAFDDRWSASRDFAAGSASEPRKYRTNKRFQSKTSFDETPEVSDKAEH